MITQDSSVLPHLLGCCEEVQRAFIPVSQSWNLSGQSASTKDPACRELKIKDPDVHLQTRHSQTNKIFSKESSKSIKKCILFGKESIEMLQLHNNNKIMSFPNLWKYLFLKNNKAFPQKSHPWGNSFQECGQQKPSSQPFPTASRRGWDLMRRYHTGCLLSLPQDQSVCFEIRSFEECFLFPSLA